LSAKQDNKRGVFYCLHCYFIITTTLAERS